MNGIFKFGITLLILISVALLCSSIALYIIKENEIEKRILLEMQVENMTATKEKIGLELEELKKANSGMELELALKEKEIQNLREKFDLVRMEGSLFEEKESTLAKRLASTQESFLELEKNYEQLQQAKEILEQRLKEAIAVGSGIKLKTIVVEPKEAETEEVEKKTVEGEVLAVNKEYEFLVINLGLNNGIAKDSKISIYKGSELIAYAEVEKLYENISAVTVNDREQLRRVKVGDAVIATIEGSFER